TFRDHERASLLPRVALDPPHTEAPRSARQLRQDVRPQRRPQTAAEPCAAIRLALRISEDQRFGPERHPPGERVRHRGQAVADDRDVRALAAGVLEMPPPPGHFLMAGGAPE